MIPGERITFKQGRYGKAVFMIPCLRLECEKLIKWTASFQWSYSFLDSFKETDYGSRGCCELLVELRKQ